MKSLFFHFRGFKNIPFKSFGKIYPEKQKLLGNFYNFLRINFTVTYKNDVWLRWSVKNEINTVASSYCCYFDHRKIDDITRVLKNLEF